ncbi:amidohydrolase family protein [Actinophytocola sp.]|uniref:amidohydrolase family protein n=1 Tax=Actinophytocola sp. TaxID=1872138 RepID=UPI003899F536
MRIIDVWAQHPTLRFIQHDMFASLRGWTGAERLTEEPPVSLTISAMDAANVDVALISAWHGPEGRLISNDEVAEFTAHAPDRLAGVASVDLRHPMNAVRELRRCVRDLGFVALRVVPWLWGWPPDDRHYYPLYAECVELDIPFCTQVGHTGPLRTSETGRPIPYLDNVALDFPELTIVAGHIGYPWTEEMIAVARKHRNVYIDTSAYTSKRIPPELVRYLNNPHHKVLFGTNYPMITPEKALADLDTLGLDDHATDLYLHGNAERVFALSKATPGAQPPPLVRLEEP